MLPNLVPIQTTNKTLELREVIEGGVNIWDFEYPSYYKGEEKTAFEKKVVDHFYFREIGAETVGRFLHYFRRTMREIMPLYIQRYKSVELMDDPEIRPLENYNMIEEFSQDTSETGTHSDQGSNSASIARNSSSLSESTENGTDTQEKTQGADVTRTGTENNSTINARSDTPEGQLALSMAHGADNGLVDHATELTQDAEKRTQNTSEKTEGTESGTLTRKNTGIVDLSEEGSETQTGTSSASGETSRDGSTTHKLTRRGNIGVTTYADLLEGYRKTFLNIDLEIIQELEICFMGVY